MSLLTGIALYMMRNAWKGPYHGMQFCGQCRPWSACALSARLQNQWISGRRMCTNLVNRLEDEACPVDVWLGKLTMLDMSPLGWLGRKTSTQTNRMNGNLLSVSTNRECPDQTVWMRMLIWTCAVGIWHKGHFSTLSIIFFFFFLKKYENIFWILRHTWLI